MGNDTYYDILGVSRSASQEEIKSKYRSLIRRVHPDLDVPPALFRQVQEAYEVLCDPGDRAAYDRLLDDGNAGVTPGGPGRGARGPVRPSGGGADPGGRRDDGRSARSRRAQRPAGPYRPKGQPGRLGLDLPPSEHTAGAVATVGLVLVVGGLALDTLGWALLVLGCAVLSLAAVGWLGGRGRRGREAYQRVGMAAVDSMSGRQFEVLLEHFFALKGYRVARLASRRRIGADMFVDDSRGRTVVQIKRWSAVVDHDAVQQAVVARARYGVERAMLVTSSSYSPQAVSVAKSNGVTLWNRAMLAEQLAAFPGIPPRSALLRFTADLRAGSRICLGLLAVLVINLGAVVAHARKRDHDARREL